MTYIMKCFKDKKLFTARRELQYFFLNYLKLSNVIYFFFIIVFNIRQPILSFTVFKSTKKVNIQVLCNKKIETSSINQGC